MLSFFAVGRSSAFGLVESLLRFSILWCDNLALPSSLGSDGVTLSQRFEAMAEVNILAAGPFLCTKQRPGPSYYSTALPNTYFGWLLTMFQVFLADVSPGTRIRLSRQRSARRIRLPRRRAYCSAPPRIMVQDQLTLFFFRSFSFHSSSHINSSINRNVLLDAASEFS